MKYCPSRVTAVWLGSLQNSQVLPSLSRVSRTDTFSREGTPYFSVSTVTLQGMYTENWSRGKYPDDGQAIKS